MKKKNKKNILVYPVVPWYLSPIAPKTWSGLTGPDHLLKLFDNKKDKENV